MLGRIVGVTDGDTIVLLDDANQQHKLRLAGIDAPEKGQAYGQASKQSLSEMTFNRLVNADCPKFDRYGRMVCVVWVGGKDINMEQIRLGLAWHYKKYQDEQQDFERVAYSKAEYEARTSKRGLWLEQQPIPPWEWRQMGRR